MLKIYVNSVKKLKKPNSYGFFGNILHYVVLAFIILLIYLILSADVLGSISDINVSLEKYLYRIYYGRTTGFFHCKDFIIEKLKY